MQITSKEFYCLVGCLKRQFSRSKLRRKVLLRARREYPAFKKNGQPAKRPSIKYVCASCGNEYPAKQVQVDHIDPVVPIGTAVKDMDLELLLSRLFCKESNLQVLCVNCHKEKSKKEMKERNSCKKN